MESWLTVGVNIIMTLFIAITSYYARKQSNIMKDASIIQQRAYVGMANQKQNITFDTVTNNIVFTFHLKNYGATPAKDIKILSHIDILPTDLEPNYSPPVESPDSLDVSYTLYPDDSIGNTIKSKTTFEMPRLNNAINFKSNERISIFVKITYVDIFGAKRYASTYHYCLPETNNEDSNLMLASGNRFNDFN